MQDRTAKDREPDNTKQGRQQPLDQNELPQRTAVGAADHEQTQQRRIGHPVHPPVHIPALGPHACIGIGRGIQAVGEELGEIAAQGLREQIAEIGSGSGQEHKQQQNKEELDVPVGEPGDSRPQATDGGGVIAHKPHGNDRNIDDHAGLNARKCLDSGGQLHGAIAQAAGHGSGQCESRPGVKCVGPFAVDHIFSENRDQHGAGPEWRPLVQDQIGQDDAGDHAGGIGRQAPLHEAAHHAPQDGPVAAGLQTGIRRGLHGKDQRFRSAPEHHAGADTRAQGNTEPLHHGEFGLSVGTTQFDLSQRGDHHNNTEYDHGQTHQTGEPAQSPHGIVHHKVIKNIIKLLCIDQNGPQHDYKQDHRHRHDGPFDFHFLFHFFFLP